MIVLAPWPVSPDFPLGDALEVFIRREDAQRFVEEVHGDDSELAAKLRIEERELEAGQPGGVLGLAFRPPRRRIALTRARKGDADGGCC